MAVTYESHGPNVFYPGGGQAPLNADLQISFLSGAPKGNMQIENTTRGTSKSMALASLSSFDVVWDWDVDDPDAEDGDVLKITISGKFSLMDIIAITTFSTTLFRVDGNGHIVVDGIAVVSQI